MPKILSYDILSPHDLFKLTQDGETNQEQILKLKKVLNKAIKEELTLKQQQVIDLYYFQSKNTVQIAKILNRNKSTVSRTKQAALKKLKECLKYSIL